MNDDIKLAYDKGKRNLRKYYSDSLNTLVEKFAYWAYKEYDIENTKFTIKTDPLFRYCPPKHTRRAPDIDDTTKRPQKQETKPLIKELLKIEKSQK